MFTHLLPSCEVLFAVRWSDYAERHFRKDFRRKYKSGIWDVTEDSIRQDLARIGHASHDLQRSQQVDELWHEGNIWVFKYDFRVARTTVSAKTSGNRVVGVLDARTGVIEIIMIYGKTDLPKNMSETQYIKKVVGEVRPDVGWE